ncbi:MAG TPA: hypothetical protein DGT21_11315 [Armatimonadetes bacterium]|nr:hypothetical protein [Armatimonadota bacterium]
MKISVRSMNLGLPMYEGIKTAGKMGLDGIALWYSEDFLWLPKVKEDGGKSVLDACEKAGLEICAITAGLGSFADPKNRPVAIQKARDELEVCRMLDIPRITGHVGVMPADLSTPEAEAMIEALRIVGDEAARLGKTLACETGPEDARTMLDFIEAVDSEGLAINYDPANFIIYGFEWFEGVEMFGDLIDHTHAKDAKRNADGSAEETPIGEGDIDFGMWIDALRGVGFDGWLCIERETGDDRLGDVERGMHYLRKLI